jgi:hypothetical protein
MACPRPGAIIAPVKPGENKPSPLPYSHFLIIASAHMQQTGRRDQIR